MYPVTQAMAYKFPDDGVVGIHGVSAARKVMVVTRFIVQHVVHAVFKPLH